MPRCTSTGQEESESDDGALDEDLRSVLGKPSLEGPKGPAPLTAGQCKIVEALLGKHGHNIDAMVMDSKLNRMLLPAGKLRRMVAAFHVHPAGARVSFQQPKKGLS